MRLHFERCEHNLATTNSLRPHFHIWTLIMQLAQAPQWVRSKILYPIHPTAPSVILPFFQNSPCNQNDPLRVRLIISDSSKSERPLVGATGHACATVVCDT